MEFLGNNGTATLATSPLQNVGVGSYLAFEAPEQWSITISGVTGGNERH
jgi:hypothetical protein